MIGNVERKTKRRVFSIVVYVALGLFCVFTFGPLLWLLSLSFKTQLQAFADPPVFIFLPTLNNYQKLFVESGFLKFFANSLFISTLTTVSCLAVGTPAAYAITKLQKRWKNVFLVWIILTRMVPAMTYIIPFFIVFSKSGLIDTRLGLVFSYFTFNLPLVIWLMRSFFMDLPESLEDAALIDGATISQAFLKIILPITGPGLVSTGILTFIMSWNEFIFALVLTRRQAVTASIAIVNLMKYEGTEWGQMGAGAIVLTIPAIFIALFVGKYLAKGLTSGAVKG